MTSEVAGTVTGLTIAATSRTKRGIGGGAVGSARGEVMTGHATIMHLVSGNAVNRYRGVIASGSAVTGIAIDVGGDLSGMIGVAMLNEVRAVTGITITATDRAVRGLSGGGVLGDNRVHNFMTGGTTVVHLIIGCTNRDTRAGTNHIHRWVTGVVAVRGVCYHLAAVIATIGSAAVTGSTVGIDT
jgi:hypothetical protein